MGRRVVYQSALAASCLAAALAIGCQRGSQAALQEDMAMASGTSQSAPRESKSPQTEAEWKQVLTPEQYRVMREKGTEAPFSGEYYRTDKEGVYHCIGCDAPLFSSATKFDAGCGWPSFWQAIEAGNLKTLEDNSHGMQRIEVQCRRCGAHLGHVFDDGPRPTGLRYCINSVAIRLEEKPGPTAAKSASLGDETK
jgi:peptide-methionine (R)-S-oxide reductase